MITQHKYSTHRQNLPQWLYTFFFAATFPLLMGASCEDQENTTGAESGCYSPTQNVDDAYDAGAVGCACDRSIDEDVCVNGTGLTCDITDKWQVVEDSPCMPAATCQGEVVATEGDCLVDDAYCLPLDDGTWCTGTGTHCEDDIVATSADCLVDDAYCIQMSNGTWCTGPTTPACPKGYSPLAEGETCAEETDSPICFAYSMSLICELTRVYTVEECESAGGQAKGDPGDGSLVTQGCPDNQTTLGFIDAGWIEGGLCCQ